MTRKAIFLHVGARGLLDRDIHTLLTPMSGLLAAPLLTFEANQTQRLYAPQPGQPDALGTLIPMLSDPESPRRMFLSDQHCLSTPPELLVGDTLYAKAPVRLSAILPALADHDLTIILQVCSLPQLAFVVQNETFRDRLSRLGWEPLYDFSWRPIIQHIRRLAPNARIWVKPNLSVPRRLGDLALQICGVSQIEGLTYFPDQIRPLLNFEGQTVLDRWGDEQVLLRDVDMLLLKHRIRRTVAKHGTLFDDLITRRLFADLFKKDMRGIRKIVDAVYV